MTDVEPTNVGATEAQQPSQQDMAAETPKAKVAVSPKRPDDLNELICSYDARPICFSGCFCVCIKAVMDMIDTLRWFLTCQWLPCCRKSKGCCGGCPCSLGCLISIIGTIICCIPVLIVNAICAMLPVPQPTGCGATLGNTACGTLCVCPYACCGCGCPLEPAERAFWVSGDKV